MENSAVKLLWFNLWALENGIFHFGFPNLQDCVGWWLWSSAFLDTLFLFIFWVDLFHEMFTGLLSQNLVKADSDGLQPLHVAAAGGSWHPRVWRFFTKTTNSQFESKLTAILALPWYVTLIMKEHGMKHTPWNNLPEEMQELPCFYLGRHRFWGTWNAVVICWLPMQIHEHLMGANAEDVDDLGTF